jgi:hypothetical protein
MLVSGNIDGLPGRIRDGSAPPGPLVPGPFLGRWRKSSLAGIGGTAVTATFSVTKAVPETPGLAA